MSRRQFVLILLLVVMTFFAGYGFGKQANTPQVSQESQEMDPKGDAGHGHSGSDANGSGSKSIDMVAAKAVWAVENKQAGQETSIRINLQDEAGNPVDKLDINHEKLLHLIVVSKDLSYFNHIHPKYNGQGEFVITNTFPSGGDYKLIADFVPTGGSKTTQTEWIKIEGASEPVVPLAMDNGHSKIVDGVEVTLVNDHPEAGTDFKLDFQLTDANTKEPITDLEQYLGAVGHVVVLSEDTEDYLHVHPVEEKAKGPEAKFVTNFPSNGTYKIWGQFQRNGKVFTVPFVIRVP